MSTHAASYRAFVIGAGNIGAFLDQPGADSVLTHCHAYFAEPRTELCGIFDIQSNRAEEAARRWNTTAYSDLSEGLKNANPDVVSICTPSNERLSVLNTIFSSCSPRYLFIEKPVSLNPEELQKITTLLESKRVGTQVNYIRNFDPTMKLLQEKIQAGSLGEFQRGAYFYGKGFKNNGSHLLQLLSFLLGTPEEFEVGQALKDYNEDDLTLEVKLKWKGDASVTLLPLNENQFSTIEGILYFDQARLHLKQFGIQWNLAMVREDPVFPGYRDIDESQAFEQSGLLKALPAAVSKIVRELDEGTPDTASWKQVLKVENLMHQIAQTFSLNLRKKS